MESQGTTKKGISPSKVLALNSLVEIAPGSIVSRTIIDRPVGTVSLFAFDEGQGLSEHSAPFDALVQVLRGGLEITIGGEPVNPQTGDLVLMPANIPHALRALVPTIMLLTMIKG